MNRFLILLTCIILTACGQSEAAVQAINAAGAVTSVASPEAGRTYAGAKRVKITSNYTITSPMTWGASDPVLEIEKGGLLTFSGSGSLDLTGAVVVLPDSQVFAGTMAVTGMKEARPEWFGTTGAALNSSLAASDVVLVSANTFTSSAATISTNKTITGSSGGKANEGRSIIQASANGDYLLKFNNLNTVGAGLSRNITIRDVVFDGNSKTFADAMVVIEGAHQVHFVNCMFTNGVGRIFRFRQVNELQFSGCLFMNWDASASEAIYFSQVGLDSGGSPFLSFNVNGISFDTNCHFESIQGTYIRTHPQANVDIMRFIGTKFESNLDSGSAGWTLLDLVNVHRLYIGAGTTFQNYRPFYNYSTVIKLSSSSGELCQGTLIEGVNIRGIDGTTTFLDNGKGAATVLGEGITYYSTDGNTPIITNTSTYPFKSYGLRDINSTAAGVGSKDISNRRGAISVHDASWGTGTYVVDTGSRNIQGTVYTITGDGNVLADLPLSMVSGRPNAFRLAIRMRTSAGTGQVKAQIGTTLLTAQTVAATYATYYFDINASQVATLGASGSDRLRFLSVGADTYYIDQVYLDDLPNADANMPTPYAVLTLTVGATASVTLPPTNTSQRAVFLLRADIPELGGYALVESNGAALGAIQTGAKFDVGTTNPDTAGKFNVYLTGNLLTIKNNYSSTRDVYVYPSAK